MGLFKFFLFILGCCSFCEGYSVQPIIPCSINRDDKRAGDVAICMMFQNEGRYIQEWIEYHKTIGVSHFYLYNNASDDDFWSVLLPYIESGEVELYNLPLKSANVFEHNELQKAAYNHALVYAKDNNEWLAVIDSDEFICMPNHDNLGKFLESYSYAGGVLINWVMYGSSGIEELAPTDMQIDHFLYRTPDDWEENFNYKSIVRTKCVKKIGIHYSTYRTKYKAVFANHQRFSLEPKYKIPPIHEIRLNHYWWRDEKYFREVKLPRRNGWLKNLTNEEIENRRQIYNSIYDPSMLPFAEKTREKILAGSNE